MSEPIDPKNIPVIAVIQQSLMLPIKHPKLMAATVGIFLLGLAVMVGLFFLLFSDGFSGGYDPDRLFNSFASNFGIALVVALYVGALLVFVFNLWLRFAIMEDDGAWKQSSGAWIKQILKNELNFVWIAVVMMVAMIIPTMIFGAVMIGPMQHVLVGDLGSASDMLFWAAAIMLLLGLPLAFLACVIYAYFSFNLVEGALGEPYVSSSLPRDQVTQGVVRFSLILFVVYVAGELINLFADLFSVTLGLEWIVMALQGITYIYGIAIIGAAHGIVFRMKTGRHGTLAEKIAQVESSEVTATDYSESESNPNMDD